MNCDQFAERMNDCLDRRQPLAGDAKLRRHAQQCDSCRAEMETWDRVESVLPCVQSVTPVPRIRDRRAVPILAASGLAAAIALFVLLRAPTVESDAIELASIPATPVEPASGEHSDRADQLQLAELDPVGWWRNVQVGDWVGQTMPAVKSVQEGVAPIGRSLMRAVTILTIGSDNQTS